MPFFAPIVRIDCFWTVSQYRSNKFQQVLGRVSVSSQLLMGTYERTGRLGFRRGDFFREILETLREGFGLLKTYGIG